MAVGLAVTAAALVAAGPRGADPPRGRTDDSPHARTPAPTGDPVRRRRTAETVSAPVRIADGATVRLLRPGDRVDVIAAEQTATGADAHVVARGVLVTRVPDPMEGLAESVGTDGVTESGALVVLSVPRATAVRLAGASATARLAVTLW